MTKSTSPMRSPGEVDRAFAEGLATEVTGGLMHDRHYPLLRLHHALTAALPYAGSRALADGPTAAELAVEAEFAEEIESALADNYRYPLRRGMTAVRAANIGFNETVRMTRRHLLHGYGRNGVRRVVHRMLRENRPYPDCLCPSLDGTEYAISARNPFSNIPEEGLIPVHAGCNCYYEAGLAGWEAPEEVWTGE